MGHIATAPIAAPKTPQNLIENVERVGIGPMADPRRASRRAALQALEELSHLFDLSQEANEDLQIVTRLVAVIASINGPGQEQKH